MLHLKQREKNPNKYIIFVTVNGSEASVQNLHTTFYSLMLVPFHKPVVLHTGRLSFASIHSYLSQINTNKKGENTPQYLLRDCSGMATM